MIARRYASALRQPPGESRPCRSGIHQWVAEEAAVGTLSPKAAHLLDAVLYRGELPRGELGATVGTGERQARRIAAALIEMGAGLGNLVRALAYAPAQIVRDARQHGVEVRPIDVNHSRWD
jgi:hypothetical protein